LSGPFSLEGAGPLDCDVLVIGSGAGASSAASVLAAAGRDVLMVEEGPYIPARDAPRGLSHAMPALWRGGGLTVALGKPPITFAEGRCAGGGTEINSAIFQQAPQSVIEGWAGANAIADFTPESLQPYYDRAAAAVNASLTPGPLGRPTDILRQAGEAMGWQVTPLMRGHNGCVGSNQCSSACPTGAKSAMTSTLLPKALAAGLRLITDCRVERVTRKGRRVTGVIAAAIGDDGARRKVTIRCRDLILSAGATQTPALLQRSGLSETGAAPFQLHPTLRLLARFKEPVDAHRYRLPLVAITEFMPRLRFGGSVMTLGTFGMALAEDWGQRADMIADHRHLAMYYAMIRPKGWGRVRAVPGLREPWVTYDLAPEDWTALSNGAAKLAGALFAAGAEWVGPAVTGHPGWTSAAAAAAWAESGAGRERAALMTIHIFSSRPMGERAGLPVDSFGRLRAADNVTVADASVLPTAPGVNPQATIMALAFRAADAFLHLNRPAGTT
jgi:choline dehydrogenase-like flavoprotein